MLLRLPHGLLASCLFVACWATPALAQQPTSPPPDPGGLRVFFDCQRCSFDFIRQEIAFIDWVRDRRDAQVHVLVAIQGTGSGLEYQLEYIGAGDFAGQDQALRYASSRTDTDDERRRGLLRTLMLGLGRYIAQTDLARHAQLVVTPPEQAPSEAAATTADVDPWDFWVFRVGLDAEIDGEQQQDERSFSGELTASRTTDAWKLRFEAENDYREQRFDFEDGSTLREVARDLQLGGQAVKSLGPRWGVGVGAGVRRSTFFNLGPSYRLAGALQRNLFPYTESSRRELTATYFVGATRYRYSEETIFELERETLIDQGLLLSLDLRQPWGSASFDLEAMHFLRYPGEINLELRGNLEYRIVRGLSLDLESRVESIRSQRFLPRRGATQEEILLEQRALATDSRFSISLGLSYTFGSIFNNVVNSRLSGRSNGFHEIF